MLLKVQRETQFALGPRAVANRPWSRVIRKGCASDSRSLELQIKRRRVCLAIYGGFPFEYALYLHAPLASVPLRSIE